MRSRRTWLLVLASLAAIVAVPVLLHLGFFLVHLASYDGTCGPHAPDIPAHPCDRGAYVEEFGVGFAGVGLLLIEALAAVVAVVVVAAVWAGRVRRVPREGSSR
jgi:hypothetical protein